MKQIFTFTASALLLASCQQIDLGDKISSVVAQDDTYSVLVTSKSGDSNVDIPSPLTIYAVNADGLVEKRASVESGETVGSLHLRKGEYTLYAVAGSETGESEIVGENIVTTGKGYFDTPIMQGTKEITVEDDDLSTTLSMSYAVASVDLTLSDIPTTVVSTTVKVESQYGSMDISRDYSGLTSATFDLTKQSDGTTWKSATVYMFPGTSSKTKLTITHETEDENTLSYTVNYNAALVAGTPYHFNGTYKDANKTMEISCNIETEGWGTPIVSSFDFGPGTSGETTPPQYADGDYVVDAFPSSGSVWAGHVVAYMNGNVGLLISKSEWSGLSKDSDLQTIASNYSEDGISGWNIPTAEQARNIVGALGIPSETRTNLNKLTLDGWQELPSSNVYFLCEGAEKRYTFYSNNADNAISNAGISPSYHLRLVKEVTFKLKD